MRNVPGQCEVNEAVWMHTYIEAYDATLVQVDGARLLLQSQIKRVLGI